MAAKKPLVPAVLKRLEGNLKTRHRARQIRLSVINYVV